MPDDTIEHPFRRSRYGVERPESRGGSRGSGGGVSAKKTFGEYLLTNGQMWVSHSDQRWILITRPRLCHCFTP